MKANRYFSHNLELKRNTPLIGLLLFFLYIFTFNILNNLLLLLFGNHSKILIVASYCRNILPNAKINNGLEIALILTLLKFGVVISSVTYKNILLKYKAGQIFLFILICFSFIELYSFVIFIYCKLFGGLSIKYMVTTLYLYALGEQSKYFYLSVILNVGLFFGLSFYLSKSLKQILKYPFLKAFIYSALSVILLVMVHYLFRKVFY